MVVKVGMVGDSQIGKTSLMVKYVEGKFDEDYIETLGAQPSCGFLCMLTSMRRQLHGEEHFDQGLRDYVQHMGPWRYCASIAV